mmetsp:Transcript_111742/g.197188  ORF Transcript_111742/g.197188 Transcript_111742/m.197188 type:complete len:141 (+) Transcript_111742:62-484(+)
MRVLAILWAFLVCAGHGRRVRTTNQGPGNHGGLSDHVAAPTPKKSLQSLLLTTMRLRGGYMYVSGLDNYIGDGGRGWMYGSPDRYGLDYAYGGSGSGYGYGYGWFRGRVTKLESFIHIAGPPCRSRMECGHLLQTAARCQ